MRAEQRRMLDILLATTASIAWLAVTSPAQAQSAQAPTVAAGSIAITRQGTTTVVNQTTDRGIIDWRSFSIGAGEAMRFEQPGRSSVTLNRVTGSELSRIDGNLSATGQIWLANPNGVMIGPSGQVNVGGLLATTGRIDALQFLNSGRASIDQIARDTSIVNLGSVNIAEGGYAALAAASIRNEGLVAARKGSVAVGAGKAMTVDFIGDKLITFQVTKPLDEAAAPETMISMGGRIVTEGGTVLMSARAAKGVMDNVINLKGHLVANSVTVDGGTVSFGDGGIVQVSGRIDASDAAGKGGSVAILGEKVGLMEGASIDASGALGGGSVLVGGDWQGKGPNHNATVAYIAPTASINADATTAGNGGKVVVWADDSARFEGMISARGGALGGNGGQVETSGKRALHIGDGAVVTTAARAGIGRPGAWLLDPNDISISTATDSNITKGSPFGALGAGASSINVATISAALSLGDVTIQTSTGSGGGGDITFSSGTITTKVTTARTLTLKADRDIIVTNGTVSLTGAKHNVVFHSAATATEQSKVDGDIRLSGATITTSGGVLEFKAGSSGTLVPQSALNQNGASIDNKSLLDAGAGSISVSGATSASLAGTSGIRIDGESTLKAAGGITIRGFGNDVAGDAGNAVTIGEATISATADGAISIIGDRRAGKGNNIYLTDKASITSVRGAITLTGTSALGGGSDAIGIHLDGGKVTSSGGNITIAGTGASNGGDRSVGVLLRGEVSTTGSGSINVTGIRGNGASAHNVMFGDATTLLKTESGAITIDASSKLLGGVDSNGIRLTGTVHTSHGAIKITATGSEAGGGDPNGFYSESATIKATDSGTIEIVGTRGAGTAHGAENIDLASGTTISTKTGTLFLDGAAKVGGVNSESGFSMRSSTQVSTESGEITIKGHSSGAKGVWLAASSSKITATGEGTINIEAETGLPSKASDIQTAGVISTVGGAITVSANSYATTTATRIDAGTGTVTLTPITSSSSFTVDKALLGYVTASTLEIGRSDLSAAITIPTGVVLTANTTFLTKEGNVTFQGKVDAASSGSASLKVNTTSGKVSFADSVGSGTALASIDISGPLTTSAAEIRTTGTQSYAGNVVLASTTTIKTSGANVTFAGSVNAKDAGTQGLVGALGTGTLSLIGGVGQSSTLASLTVGGVAALGGTIKTKGSQSYGGAVTLSSDTVLSIMGGVPGASLSFGGTLSGMGKGLALSTAGGGITLPSVSVASLSLTTGGGAVSQSKATTVTASTNAFIDAGSGAVTLGNTGNSIAELALTAGDAAVTVSGDMKLSDTEVSSLSLTTNGTVTQSGSLNSKSLSLNGSSGTYTLTKSSNKIASLTADTATITLKNSDDDGLRIGAAGVTVKSGLSVTQSGSGQILAIDGPINLGSTSASLTIDGKIAGTGTISGEGATLTLSVVDDKSTVTTAGNVTVNVVSGKVSVNGVLFPTSPAVVVNPSPPTNPSAPTVVSTPSVASVPTIVSTPTIASVPTVPSTLTVASVPSIASEPSSPSLVSQPTVGPLLVDTSVIAQPILDDFDRILPGLLIPPVNFAPIGLQVPTSSTQRDADLSANAQRAIMLQTPTGALIPPSPNWLSATGAPLAASVTVKVDAADSGGVGGQAISTSDGAFGSSGRSKSWVEGLVTEGSPSRTPANRNAGEPPLAQLPSTLSDEAFLD
jgi:filamentous hemagglutinin family protein